MKRIFLYYWIFLLIFLFFFVKGEVKAQEKNCPSGYQCFHQLVCDPGYEPPDDLDDNGIYDERYCGTYFYDAYSNKIYKGVCCKVKTNDNNINRPDFQIRLPGITCGNAEATDGSNHCCVLKNFEVQEYADEIIPDFGCFLGWCVSNIPKAVVKAMISLPVFETIYNFQPKQYSECVNGKAEYSIQGCVCTPNKTDSSILCERYLTNKEAEYKECKKCAGKGIWTALGCLETRPEKFILNNVFKTGLGLAGLVALLCIIYSAFILQTSEGNPEKLKNAQEILTSCIMGLVLIIFSVFLLRLIGIDILKIPGFGK